MKLWKYLAGGLFAGVMALQTVSAFATEQETCELDDQYCHRFVKAEQYYKELNPDATPEEWQHMQSLLRPFTDPEAMAAVMADPAKLSAWMTGLTDPDALHLMMRCSQEPVMWNTWLRAMGNPVKMAKATLPFMNPVTYVKWMMAPIDLDMYAGFAPFISGDYYVDWANKATTLKFYEPTWSWAYPEWTVDKVTWMLDPQTYLHPIRWVLDSVSDIEFAVN